MELKFVGGVYGGNIKPTPFLCLTLKMLQIQPEKDIIVEFIKNEDFKYVGRNAGPLCRTTIVVLSTHVLTYSIRLRPCSASSSPYDAVRTQAAVESHTVADETTLDTLTALQSGQTHFCTCYFS